jgi:hypothetical protein
VPPIDRERLTQVGIRTPPAINVRLAPILLDTKFVISIASAVTTR